MLIVSAPAPIALEQTVMLKSMVPDPGQFDSDWTKFEDWWRRICLFLKSNRVIVTDNKITVVLAQLREDIKRIYAQKKIDQMKEEDNTQDWNKFVKEVKTAFSNKSKTVDAKWKIKTF